MGHMLTKAQERTQRIDTREALKSKKAILRQAKLAKREALKEAREHIRAARKALPAKLAHWREINRQIIKRAIEGERHAVMADKLQIKHGIKGRAHELVTAANEAIDRDLKHLRWLGKRRHKPTSSARVAAGLKAAETRHEQDEFVRNELPAELHAAWEENKHKIKAKPHTPRWEVAIEYFEEHPEVVAEANARELERGIQNTIEREHEERARMQPPKAAKRSKAKASKRKPSKRASSKGTKRKAQKLCPHGFTNHTPCLSLSKARAADARATRSKMKPPKKIKPAKAPKVKRSKRALHVNVTAATPADYRGFRRSVLEYNTARANADGSLSILDPARWDQFVKAYPGLIVEPVELAAVPF